MLGGVPPPLTYKHQGWSYATRQRIMTWQCSPAPARKHWCEVTQPTRRLVFPTPVAQATGRRLRSPTNVSGKLTPMISRQCFPPPDERAPGGGYAAHRADGVSSHSRKAGGGYAAHLSPGSVPTSRCAGTGVRLRNLPGGRCSQHSTRKRRVEVTQPDRVQRQAYTDFLDFRTVQKAL